VAERFAGLFLRVRGEALWNYSLANRTHDVHLAVALARRLRPSSAGVTALRERLERTRRAVNALYVSAYRQALELARDGHDRTASGALVASIRERSRFLEGRLGEVEADLGRLLDQPFGRFSPLRQAAASMLVCSLGAAGCSAVGDDDPDAGETVTDSQTDDACGADTCSDDDLDTGTGAKCSQQQLEDQREALLAALAAEVPCFSGSVRVKETGDGLFVDDNLSATTYVCDDEGEHIHSFADAAAAQAVVDGQEADCLIDYAQPGWNVADVHGGRETELTEIATKSEESCEGPLDDYRIALDADGRVTGVFDNPAFPGSLPQETLDCIAAALAGLSFPCLADFQVCAEYIIPE